MFFIDVNFSKLRHHHKQGIRPAKLLQVIVCKSLSNLRLVSRNPVNYAIITTTIFVTVQLLQLKVF